MWEPIAIAAYFGLLGWGVVRHQRGRLRFWRETAAACGLRVREVSSWAAFRLKLQAQSGPLEVRFKDTGQSKTGTRITVVIPGPPGFAGVRIRREQLIPVGAREIEIGDETFDRKFFVEGPQRLLLLLLDAEARDLLLRVNAQGILHLFRGELELELGDREIPEILPLLLDIGRRFSQRPDAAQRLAANAGQDPKPGVRLRNLLFLAREHPGEPATIEVLRAACTDPSLEIRLRAATELRAEGRGILVELAESTEDDAISAQAIAVVGRELPFERTRGILEHALRRRRLLTARACLEALGKSGDAAAADVLEKVLDVEKGELAVAAARALGATGLPDAEPPLLRALRREKMEIRIAAATALGRAGSTAAVLPLKDAAEAARDNELRRVLRQAIAEIQSRLQGASPGQLSLAGNDAGQLSLATDPAGQVSFPREEAGPAAWERQAPRR